MNPPSLLTGMSDETAEEIVSRVRSSLQDFSRYFNSSNTEESYRVPATVAQTLNSLCEPAEFDNETYVPNHAVSEQILEEILQFLSDPKNQILIDALSFELPKIVAKTGALSQKCKEIAKNIIKVFISNCTPRDMLSILCEGLVVQIGEAKSPLYYVILLDGLTQVLNLIQRRHVEQIKAILPVILKVLRNIPFDDLYKSAIQIGISIQEICKNMDGGKKKELSAILGLYVLQNIALVSRDHINHTSLILELSKFLPFCEFSYFGLITGSNINSAVNEITKDDGDEFINCFSLSKDGACLAVIWSQMSEDIAKSIGEDLNSVVKLIKNNKMEIRHAINILKSPLSPEYYSFKLKDQILDFLINILGGSNFEEFEGTDLEFRSFLASIFSIILPILSIMMSAFDPSLRKKAFLALKMIITAMPFFDRLDLLKSLVTDSRFVRSPSMTAILIDLARHNIFEEIKKDGNFEIRNGDKRLNIFLYALKLVEMVLKPPQGGPPDFPEDSEPILSALNLLRFILITDKIDNPSGTNLLNRDTLRKVYADWLLPLRTLVSGICRENQNSEFSDHLICALNPVQLVLHRCIELVENNGCQNGGDQSRSEN